MGEDTDTRTVRVHEDTWVELHSLKQPGDTFDDVIKKALDESGLESDLLERLEKSREEKSEA